MSTISYVIDVLKRNAFRIRMQRKLIRLNYFLGMESILIEPSAVRIDIVIPSVEKDVQTLPHVIEFARKNILHPITNIYVVSPDSEAIRRVCENKGCIFILEDNLLPIGKLDIDYKIGNLNRAGWMYQQFLKLSGNKFCTEENYLILDSDTVLIRPQVFEKTGKYIFNFSDEYHKPYFDVYERLFGYRPRCPVSFTSHHILVNVIILQQMKSDLETRNGLPWYDSIMKAIDKSESSGHSDYDTYGQYALDSMRERVLLEYWYNISLPRQLIFKIDALAFKYSDRFKSISFHSWNVGQNCIG